MMTYTRLNARSDAAGHCTIAHFAKTMGHNENSLYRRLKIDDILQPEGRPYKRHINKGYFAITEMNKQCVTVALTGKGQVWMARRYPVGFDLAAVE